jgi:segregation and condensation protein A
MPEVIEEELKITTQVDPTENRELPLPDVSPDISTDHDSLNSLHFKLPVFEGPLDILLHLIKEHKIDIYDIPIVEITGQYLVYIELLKDLDLEVAGEFLVMAATLIHIKSRMLLPPDEEETEESAEDPRAELVKRLLEYQAYKDSSAHLRKREEIWKHVFRRALPNKNEFELEPEPMLMEANVFDLLTAFQKLLAKAPEQAIEITRETLTVSDKINYIVECLENEDGIRFEDLFKEGFTKITLVVTFLALLEIVRLGLAKIYQEKSFGIIWVMNPRQQKDPVPDEVMEEVLP